MLTKKEMPREGLAGVTFGVTTPVLKAQYKRLFQTEDGHQPVLFTARPQVAVPASRVMSLLFVPLLC